MPGRRSGFQRSRVIFRWEFRLLKLAWKGPIKSVTTYWTAYGGHPALLRSPYFHVAVLVGLCCIPWIVTGGDWAGKALAVVPNLLGFSIGGFAILLALGSDKFQEVLARAGGAQKPVLVNVSTSFVHFIVVQAITLLFAITADGIWPAIKVPLKVISGGAWTAVSTTILTVAGFIGCTLLAYSITSLLAATFRVYRLVGNFVKMVRMTPRKPSKDRKP